MHQPVCVGCSSSAMWNESTITNAHSEAERADRAPPLDLNEPDQNMDCRDWSLFVPKGAGCEAFTTIYKELDIPEQV